MREAGSTAVQEIAFTIANGIEYIQTCIDRGLKIDDFAPRLSFFFCCTIEFFEEILNKIGKITIKGKDESCPATVSVANIITQNVLNGTTKTDKISLNSEISDDGHMISTIEIIITKISN